MDTNEEFEIDLVKLWEIFKKHWLVFVAICIVWAGIGFGISNFALAKEYTTSAKVIVVSDDSQNNNPNLSYTEVQLNQKLVATYSQIIMSERISDIVIANLDKRLTTNDYREFVSVSSVASTEIMQISVKCNDPLFASELANEIVKVFLDEIGNIMPVHNVSVLNSAKVPQSPSGPSVLKWTAIFGLLGIFICGCYCMFELLTDTKIKSAEDLKNVVSYPLIGAIPNSEVAIVNDVESVSAEAFKSLRTNITMRNFDDNLQIINVVSSLQGEGKSTLITNLSLSFAQMGKKVLIMDLDLKAPTLHKKLKIKNGKGVTDILNKQVGLHEVKIEYAENLDVVTAGTKIPFTSELLQSAAMRRFIAELRKEYSYIFLDSAPASIVTDGTIVSKMSDATILVVANNEVEKKQLQNLDNLLKQFEINIIGVVMTKMPLNKKYGYYNGYSYGYGYHGDKKAKGKKGKRK